MVGLAIGTTLGHHILHIPIVCQAGQRHASRHGFHAPRNVGDELLRREVVARGFLFENACYQVESIFNPIGIDQIILKTSK